MIYALWGIGVMLFWIGLILRNMNNNINSFFIGLNDGLKSLRDKSKEANN